MASTTIELKVVDDPWQEEGPALLLAGPGTGKTHQLGLRIKHLVERQGVSPESITVITFTKDAAENMRRRIADEEKVEVYISPEKRPKRILTMHGLGLEIIRSHREEVGLPEGFQVLTDTALREVLFRDAALLCGYDEKVGVNAEIIRRQSSLAATGSEEDLTLRKYESILRANSMIDYDDQILLSNRILRENTPARLAYEASAQHLLVDEYQDINPAQRELISLLSGSNEKGLFVVGDDDQSIYSFRGGTPKYIREFHEEHKPNGQVLCLVRSRRCPDKVVYASLNVIEKFDPHRQKKADPTFEKDKSGSTPVIVHDVATDDQEAIVIAAIAEESLLKKQRVLILIPARQYAEKIRRQLRWRKIHCSHPVSVDESGFSVLELADKWLENPEDNLALRGCIEQLCESGTVSVPSRKSRAEAKLTERAQALTAIANLWGNVLNERMSLWRALETRNAENPLFAEIHKKLSELRAAGEGKVIEFLTAVCESLQPWSDRKSLMDEIRAWEEELRSRGQHAENTATVMTFQAAKGLEADIVCVVGLNEGIVPRTGLSPEAIAEAARLTYVSMTRAANQLHLFHARRRDASVTYLANSFNLKASRFIDAIEKQHKEIHYHQAPSARKAKHSDPV